MNSSLITCPFCGSQQVITYLKLKDYFLTQEDFDIKVCGNLKCQFQFTYPIPQEQQMGRYYKTENYLSHSGKKQNSLAKIYDLVRGWGFHYKYKLLKKYQHFNAQTQLLDLGCGIGFFIHKMKQKSIQVFGLDISKEAQAVGFQKYGLKIADNDHLYQFPQQHFDVITLWHVLEHLHHFKKDLQQIQSILKKDGIVCVAVPNSASYDAKHYQQYWAAWDVPRHLWHFNYEQMKRLASEVGLYIHAIHLLPFDGFYNAIMSEKYKQAKFYFVKGIYHGCLALMLGILNKKKASSIVYILKKVKT